jgi:hypothetical protein
LPDLMTGLAEIAAATDGNSVHQCGPPVEFVEVPPAGAGTRGGFQLAARTGSPVQRRCRLAGGRRREALALGPTGCRLSQPPPCQGLQG